ncbi:MAG: hypothetical protein CM1200mP20_12510 [Pseudomonadota bacterium]|nr:MAG: hypothetical protein CM1200mP20_12510 [Pseudomonadota bacterium]
MGDFFRHPTEYKPQRAVLCGQAPEPAAGHLVQIPSLSSATSRRSSKVKRSRGQHRVNQGVGRNIAIVIELVLNGGFQYFITSNLLKKPLKTFFAHSFILLGSDRTDSRKARSCLLEFVTNKSTSDSSLMIIWLFTSE